MVELEPILWKLNPESNQRSSTSVSNGRGQCPSGAKSIRCWTLPTVKFIHFFGNKSLRKLLQRTRTQFIQPYRSKNVLIEGVSVVNSPMWIVHPVLCENVIVRNVNLTRFAYDLSPIHSFCLFQKKLCFSLGPNNDGVDPESCTDVWITGVLFFSGDDDIAIKSGRNADGRRLNVPSQNLVIQNCTMADGHGGITIGR